jgi:uncharacterized protein (TIGR00661 family)
MKVLYAIQGTGNGHISRSLEIVPLLKQKVDLDILISGIQGDLKVPFDIKHRFNGMSFIFGKKGGVDLLSTFIKLKTKKLYQEIKQLPVEKYDLVISDFEPVSSWASYYAKVPCIGLSHQSAVIDKSSPKPKNSDLMGQMILKYYAPVSQSFGFHFEKYNSNIYTPVIRSQVREQKVVDNGHYTVYLPSYDDEQLLKHLGKFKMIKFDVFSKHNTSKIEDKNVTIRPINNENFVKSMASSKGVICGAGFETPAEALFMNKKLLVIPMKSQYEQHCNAAALEQMGILKIKSLKKKNYDVLDDFFCSNKTVEVDYKDETSLILDKVLSTPLKKFYKKESDFLQDLD